MMILEELRDAYLADIKSIVFEDSSMRENNTIDIVSRLNRAFADFHFMASLRQSIRHNWIEVNPDQATETIVEFIKGL